MFLMVTLALCAAAVAICLLYILNTLYVVRLTRKWTFRRVEELIIGFSCLTMFLMLIWFLLDTSL
jgi:hypothetical protein